jgi:hypothetical protein
MDPYEEFRQACMEECPDLVRATSCAANCLLYENDPGPAELQVGCMPRSFRIPRSEAWQLTYAMNLLKTAPAIPPVWQRPGLPA